MARLSVPPQDQFPYHVGARCINREWFSIPMETVWRVMCEHLFFIHHALDIRILAFVLMHNHFHLLLRTPSANLPKAMRWFMGETSRELLRLGNRINQTYGGRHYKCLIASNHHYFNAYKYVYRNPVKAGLCERVEDYPFSTLGGLLGDRHLLIPVEKDLTLFSDVEGTLKWLNHAPLESNWDAFRKALRRKTFTLAKVDRKDHPLEIEIL